MAIQTYRNYCSLKSNVEQLEVMKSSRVSRCIEDEEGAFKNILRIINKNKPVRVAILI